MKSENALTMQHKELDAERAEHAGKEPRYFARVVDRVRPAFDRFVHGDEVRFTAACWMVTARGAAQ